MQGLLDALQQGVHPKPYTPYPQPKLHTLNQPYTPHPIPQAILHTEHYTLHPGVVCCLGCRGGAGVCKQRSPPKRCSR